LVLSHFDLEKVGKTILGKTKKLAMWKELMVNNEIS